LFFGYEEDGTPVTRSVDCLRRGLHVIGLPGSGKTTLLSQLALSSASRAGMLVLDPDGGLIEQIAANLDPKEPGTL
jgi:ABC-type cobalamin/Fe3+-siderophores transport system ATPase subunit